jgi:hypothetical protein
MKKEEEKKKQDIQEALVIAASSNSTKLSVKKEKERGSTWDRTVQQQIFAPLPPLSGPPGGGRER